MRKILDQCLYTVYTLFRRGIGMALKKLQKWGNSIGVRISKSVIQKLNLEVGSEIEIEPKNGRIIITPLQKKLVLNDLLSQVNKDNLHSEEDFVAEGREIW